MIGLEILNPCLDVPLSQPRRSTIDIRRILTCQYRYGKYRYLPILPILIYLDIDATSVSVEGMLVAVFMYVLMIRITSCPSDVPGKHLRFSSAHFLQEGVADKIYFSALHIFSRKGMKGVKPSSSSGSQSSFIRDLASSLLSFSPRLVRRR